ncbi:hypothetical protein P1X15_09680 [Runella sp. MFBS21]|uniref:hypothetical protein n=1 Tax=Runella sp. MFBS21 TaxID=3034018 RepID=UPI0023FA3F42|nr:hypothetical protein [Runella sp. MFBS21]MDF7817868.1 hypothetical protein [Runella sp. MFBS21]
MKNVLLKIILFCKRPGIINRLIFFGGALIALFSFFIPDVKFGLTMKNPPKLSIEQIKKTPIDDLPRYIIVTDSKVLQSERKFGLEALGDSLVSTLSEDQKQSLGESLNISSYGYVTEQKIKKRDTTLSAIYYPVYSIAEAKTTQTANALECYVVIKDTHVTPAELENDKYFTNATFSIQGRFDGTTIDSETLNLLEESGYHANKNAIILTKGNTPMSLVNAIVLSILAALIAIIVFLSFLSSSFLYKIFGVEQDVIKVNE